MTHSNNTGPEDAPSAGMEFRVLSGSRVGCRLPLDSGMYRAGSDPASDIMLDANAEATAFVLYLGLGAIGLEAVTPNVTHGGKALAPGLHALALGEAFGIGAERFTVDRIDSIWPVEDTQAETGDTAVISLEADGATDILSLNGTDSVLAQPLAIEAMQPVRTRRHRVAALTIAMSALAGGGLVVQGLRAEPRAPLEPVPEKQAHALRALVGTAGEHGTLTLTQAENGVWLLGGHQQTSEQMRGLIRAARKITPTIRIALDADEDLLAMAQDTLTRLGAVGIDAAHVRDGKLSLAGYADAKTVAKIVEALREDLPGLTVTDNQVVMPERAREVLDSLLAEASLSDTFAVRINGGELTVNGTPDARQLNAWEAVRMGFENRFGAKFPLRQQFTRVPEQTATDIVLQVGGLMPYSLLGNGARHSAMKEG